MHIKIFNQSTTTFDLLESKGGFAGVINDFCDSVDVIDIVVVNTKEIVVKYNDKPSQRQLKLNISNTPRKLKLNINPTK